MLKLRAVVGQLQWQPLFEDAGIPLAIMGLLVVFAALVLVSLFITMLPRMMTTLAKCIPERGATAARASSSEAEEPLPEELLVVIAAAVAEVIGEPHRIVHTRELTAQDLNWSLEGRIQHHTSHRIQHRDHR